MFDHRLLRRHRFALLDPTRRDALPAGIETISLAPSFVAESSRHLLPELVSVSLLKPDQRGDLLAILEAADDHGEAPPLCALLDSDRDIERIVMHLKHCQVLNRYAGAATQREWLRIHDARVFVQLMRLLTVEEQSILLGPVSCWTVYYNGEWLEFERFATADPLHTDRCRRRLLACAPDIGIINRTLDRIGARSHQDAIRLSPAIETQVGRARSSYDLTETEDLVEFAATALTVSERFDQHPEIQPLIRNPQDNEDTRLPDRLARVDKQIWQSISEQKAFPDARKT